MKCVVEASTTLFFALKNRPDVSGRLDLLTLN